MDNGALSTPLCPGCGYDLRGLTSDRCPECGLLIDASEDLAVTLPWAHRRAIGRVRAYVRTAIMATFRPKRLAANIARPVSWSDAVVFRRITVALAVVPIMTVVTVGFFLPDSNLLFPALRHPLVWWGELLAVPVAWTGLWLATLTAAGVGSYWFHARSIPIEQQNRAVALSLYGCGPMAFSPVLALVIIAIACVGTFADPDRRPWDTVLVTLICSMWGIALLIAVCWWGSTLSLLRNATHCGFARQLCLAVCLPICCAVLAGLFAVGLPAAFLWLALVVKSVHAPG